MSERDLDAYLESLVEDRRPEGFRARPGHAEVIRAAVVLRSGVPGTAAPNQGFVDALQRDLAGQTRDLAGQTLTAGPPAPTGSSTRSPRLTSVRKRRQPRVMVQAAALVLAVAAAVGTTSAMEHSSPVASGQVVAASASLRFGTLRTPDGNAIGQVYVHRGDPSWMFMTVRSSTPDQSIMCELELTNGSHLPVRTVLIQHGTGQLAHSVPVELSVLKGVRLVTPQGTTMASAAFS